MLKVNKRYEVKVVRYIEIIIVVVLVLGFVWGYKNII